jgi:hypothetical protein
VVALKLLLYYALSGCMNNSLVVFIEEAARGGIERIHDALSPLIVKSNANVRSFPLKRLTPTLSLTICKVA